MKYRSRADITTMILEVARTGATKTQIMYGAYLSYTQLVEYLKLLQEKALITHDKEKQLYRVTEKGIKFLHTSNKLNDLLRESDSKHLK